mgnify:CR=1 FL=1
MGFFDKVKGWFSNGVKSFGSGKWASPVVKTFQSIGATVKGAVSVLHQDVRDLVSGAGGIIKGAQGLVSKAIDKGASTIGSVASSLALPLAIAGGAVALYFVTRR